MHIKKWKECMQQATDAEKLVSSLWVTLVTLCHSLSQALQLAPGQTACSKLSCHRCHKHNQEWKQIFKKFKSLTVKNDNIVGSFTTKTKTDDFSVGTPSDPICHVFSPCHKLDIRDKTDSVTSCGKPNINFGSI